MKRLRVVFNGFESIFKKLNMYFMGHWFIDKFKNNVRVELTTDSCRTERSHTTETLKLHLTHGNWSSKYFIGNKILNSYGQLGDIFSTYVNWVNRSENNFFLLASNLRILTDVQITISLIHKGTIVWM